MKLNMGVQKRGQGVLMDFPVPLCAECEKKEKRITNITLVPFLIGGLLVFVQFVVTYVFSGMTVYLIYGYLTEGDGRMDKAWEIVRRDFVDILTLAAASALVNMLKSSARRNGRNSIVSSLARSAAGIFDHTVP